MARPATFSKSELLAKLTEVFRRSGYDGASMADLSKITGLSKASLYHHFPGGKAEMATTVMAEEGKRLQQLVLAPLGDLSNPAEALENSLDGVGSFIVVRCRVA
jgi:AcrR family transcriptional regulator